MTEQRRVERSAPRWRDTKIFPSESDLARAERLRLVASSTLIIMCLAMICLMALEPSLWTRRLTTVIVLLGFIGTVLLVNRLGRTSLASWIFVLGFVVLVTQRAWGVGAINSAAIAMYVLIVLLGGVLLGRLGGIVSTIASMCGALILAIGEHLALTPPYQGTPPAAMMVFLLMILCIGLVLQAMVGNTFHATILRQEEEIARRTAIQVRLDLAMRAAKITVWEIDEARGVILADATMAEMYDVEVSPDGTVPIDLILSRVHPDDIPELLERGGKLRNSAVPLEHSHRVFKRDGSLHYVRGASLFVPGTEDRGARIVGVTADVTAQTIAELERIKLLHELGERVKELRLLHGTAVAAQRQWHSTRALLGYVVNSMPPAWQYPECTEARIQLGDVLVTTPGWRETPWRQSVEFTSGGQRGLIEVVYTAERPAEHEGPFLAEERDLLASLAEMLGSMLESQRTRRELEQLVEQRTAELRSARDAAEQAARAKGTFLANMSHEIRTPMNAILGYEQLLQADANLTESQRRKLDVIRSSGDHLLTLISDILDMSRIEAGHATLSIQPFDLVTTLDEVRSMFTTQTSARGISLALEMDPSLPRGLSADAGKVRQVLINLIGNAVKFTDRGGVQVRARAVRGGETGCLVTIEVEDTGPGIAAAERELIFSAFGQATGGASHGGTGLGLPISRSFAQLMDGNITVDSTPGRGSTFTFTFVGSVVEDVVADSLRRRDRPRRLAAGEPGQKILVVDDIPTNRELLSEIMARAGFEVRAANSGEEALDVHSAWQPDLVITDLHMPGIGGLEAVRLLRVRGARTPVVVTTASVDVSTPEQVRMAGAQRLLPKPHRESELLDAISELLGVALVAVTPAVTPALPTSPDVPLESVVGDVPVALRSALVAAARAARASRILALASEMEPYAPAAARAVRDLVDTFRYDALIEALGETTSHDQ